jgi:hypothetical protein
MKPKKTTSSPTSSRRDRLVLVKMLAPLVLVACAAVYYRDFVISAIEANRVINGLILMTLTYGTALILTRLMGAQEDFRIIERFGFEAAAGKSMTQLLEEPWIRFRYVRHYLKHIAAMEVSNAQLDRDAIEDELHALNGEYNSKLELPQFLVGFMIALGLLGTFIGLLETLTGISGMLSGLGKGDTSAEQQFMALVGELRKPLAGMGIAFSASMFGLVSSLMLAIMMINLRRYISRVILCARNVMHDLTEIRKTIGPQTGAGGFAVIGGLNEPPTPRERASHQLDDLTSSTNYRSQDTNILLASRMDLLINKLEVLFRSFETSINGTTRLNELLGFGPRMKETGERTLEELKAIVMNSTEQNMIARQFVDAQGAAMTTINAILDAQRRGQAEFAQAIKGLNDKLGALDESNIANGRHLWEIRDTCAKLNLSSGMLEMIASSIGRQTLLSEALIDEARIVKQVLLTGNAPEGEEQQQ